MLIQNTENKSRWQTTQKTLSKSSPTRPVAARRRTRRPFNSFIIDKYIPLSIQNAKTHDWRLWHTKRIYRFPFFVRRTHSHSHTFTQDTHIRPGFEAALLPRWANSLGSAKGDFRSRRKRSVVWQPNLIYNRKTHTSPLASALGFITENSRNTFRLRKITGGGGGDGRIECACRRSF